jgi:hypothetical protein
LPPGKAIDSEGIFFEDSTGDRNPRLIAQSGIFTFSPSYISIEKWVVENYAGPSRRDLPVLLRFLIRNKARKDCIADLDLMNIHPRSLFPDLIGAARSCNYLLER